MTNGFSLIMIALTFGSPWLLAWAAGLAIPVAIHLWSRRRYQEVDWAAMRFLMQALRQNSRRLTIEQLILLAVRVLIFILLAIAIANPLLSPRDDLRATDVGETTSLHVLVLDSSYSMGLKQGVRSVWEEMIVAVNSRIDSAPRRDGFVLIKMAEPPEIVIQDPSFDRSAVKQEVSSLRLTDGGADLESTFSAIESVLKFVERDREQFDRIEVTLFTDLGENTWRAVAEPQVRTQLDSISRQAKLTVNQQGGAGTDGVAGENVSTSNARRNLAVVSVDAPGRTLLPGDTGIVTATLKNFGVSGQVSARVDLFVDGESRDRRNVSIPAGQQSTIDFQVKVDLPGDHRVEVRATPDDLVVDDRRFLVVPVGNTIRVLCAGGRPGETDYIRWALQPEEGRLSQTDSRIETRSIPFTSIAQEQLSDYQCVVIANVAGIRSTEASALRQYVGNGGGLIIFLGDQVQLDNYNRQMYEMSDPKLLPGRLVGFSEFDDHRLDPLEFLHPIVEPFRGVRQSGLLTTPVWKYVRAEVDSEDRSRVALGFANGDPLIVSKSVGFGRIVLCTTAASGSSIAQTPAGSQSWSGFHTWPSFVSLVHESIQYAIAGGSNRRNVIVGDVVSGKLGRSLDSRTLRMLGPDDQTIPVNLAKSSTRQKSMSMNSSMRSTTWSAGPLERAGFYTLRQSKSDTGSASLETDFAVNLETSESDLTTMTLADLPVQFHEDADSVAVTRRPTTNRPSIFQYVLGGLVMLLVCESCLAWLFGRHSSEVRVDS